MDEKYVKDMLEDIKKLALNSDMTGIIAICDNETEEIEKRTAKNEIIDILRTIEDAKYEIARLRHDDTDELYTMLDDSSKALKRLAVKEELNITTDNENV